jgi:hypothetical protein
VGPNLLAVIGLETRETKMGEHIDNRKYGKRNKKLKEGNDPLARATRVTFKNYLREIEEELLEADLEIEDDADIVDGQIDEAN